MLISQYYFYRVFLHIYYCKIEIHVNKSFKSNQKSNQFLDVKEFEAVTFKIVRKVGLRGKLEGGGW